MPVVRNLITRIMWQVDTASLRRAQAAISSVQAQTNQYTAAVNQNAGAMVFAVRRWFLGALAIAAVGRATVGAMANLEVLQTTLVNVTGSTKRAGLAFDYLTRFAARTPFTIDKVIETFVRLQQTTSLAFRTQPLEEFGELLTGLGNLASVVGTDIENVMQGIQNAVSGRIQRLQVALKTQVSIIGDEIEIKFRDRVIRTERTIEALTLALAELGNTEFADAMERQVRTLDGAFSNLKDIALIALSALGDGGLRGGLYRLVLETRDFIEANKESIRIIGVLIGAPLKILAMMLKFIAETWHIWNKIIIVWLSLKLARLLVRMTLAFVMLTRYVFLAVAAFRSLNAAVLFIPLLLLWLEDLDTFLRGGASLIGQWVKAWEHGNPAQRQLAENLRRMAEQYDGLVEAAVDLEFGWVKIAGNIAIAVASITAFGVAGKVARLGMAGFRWGRNVFRGLRGLPPILPRGGGAGAGGAGAGGAGAGRGLLGGRGIAGGLLSREQLLRQRSLALQMKANNTRARLRAGIAGINARLPRTYSAQFRQIRTDANASRGVFQGPSTAPHPTVTPGVRSPEVAARGDAISRYMRSMQEGAMSGPFRAVSPGATGGVMGMMRRHVLRLRGEGARLRAGIDAIRTRYPLSQGTASAGAGRSTTVRAAGGLLQFLPEMLRGAEVLGTSFGQISEDAEGLHDAIMILQRNMHLFFTQPVDAESIRHEQEGMFRYDEYTMNMNTTIDARGADAGTEEGIRRALQEQADQILSGLRTNGTFGVAVG